MTTRSAALARPVAVNLLGVIEHPVLGDGPYRIDVDGHPYLPVGDGNRPGRGSQSRAHRAPSSSG